MNNQDKKIAKLNEVLRSCADDSGKAIKIPILSTIYEVDGELVCEVEGYSNIVYVYVDEDNNLQ